MSVVFGACVASCSGDPSLHTLEQSLDTTPSVQRFALFAERSIKLGAHDSVSGATGVAIAASSTFGAQTVLADHVSVGDVYSPSVAIGDHSNANDVYAASLQVQSAVSVHTRQPFPSTTMPTAPLALPASTGGPDVSVSTPTALPPGAYGALDVHSVLQLSAGAYSFSSIMVEPHASISASGSVNVRVAGRMVVQDHVAISSGATAGLRFDISGSDAVAGPACLVGAHTSLRALISAPHGTMLFSDHVSAVGAFAASDIAAGVNTSFALEGGFSQTAPGEQGSQPLSGYFGRQPDGRYPIVSPVPSDTLVSISIGLPVRDAVGLQNLIQSVSDPTSSSYRHYLSTSQFKAMFGATDADYQAVIQWATSMGLVVEHTFEQPLGRGLRYGRTRGSSDARQPRVSADE